MVVGQSLSVSLGCGQGYTPAVCATRSCSMRLVAICKVFSKLQKSTAPSHTREFTFGPLSESRSAPDGRQLVGQVAYLTLESASRPLQAECSSIAICIITEPCTINCHTFLLWISVVNKCSKSLKSMSSARAPMAQRRGNGINWVTCGKGPGRRDVTFRNVYPHMRRINAFLWRISRVVQGRNISKLHSSIR